MSLFSIKAETTWQGKLPPVLTAQQAEPQIGFFANLNGLGPKFCSADAMLAAAPLSFTPDAQKAIGGARLTHSLIQAGRREVGRFRGEKTTFAPYMSGESFAERMIYHALLPHENNEALAANLAPALETARSGLDGLVLRGRIEAQNVLFRGFWHADSNVATVTIPLTQGPGMLVAIKRLFGDVVYRMPDTTAHSTWLNMWHGRWANLRRSEKERPAALWHHHATCNSGTRLLVNISADLPQND